MEKTAASVSLVHHHVDSHDFYSNNYAHRNYVTNDLSIPMTTCIVTTTTTTTTTMQHDTTTTTRFIVITTNQLINSHASHDCIHCNNNNNNMMTVLASRFPDYSLSLNQTTSNALIYKTTTKITLHDCVHYNNNIIVALLFQSRKSRKDRRNRGDSLLLGPRPSTPPTFAQKASPTYDPYGNNDGCVTEIDSHTSRHTHHCLLCTVCRPSLNNLDNNRPSCD